MKVEVQRGCCSDLQLLLNPSALYRLYECPTFLKLLRSQTVPRN